MFVMTCWVTGMGGWYGVCHVVSYRYGEGDRCVYQGKVEDGWHGEVEQAQDLARTC